MVIPQQIYNTASGDGIAWSASHEGLDIVDDLVGERLHGLLARPCHVRGQDEIRRLELEQRVAGARRLDAEDVEARARDRALPEGLGERRLVDQSAAGRVDEERELARMKRGAPRRPA